MASRTKYEKKINDIQHIPYESCEQAYCFKCGKEVMKGYSCECRNKIDWRKKLPSYEDGVDYKWKWR